MTTHTAIAATTLGSIDTVQVLSTKPGAGQVLVKVAYSSMTPIDVYAIDVGLYVDSHPYRLGYSLSGTITEIGNAVPDLAVGDRIAAFGFPGQEAKAMQQYCVLGWEVCSKIPNSLPLDAAATIPDNFLTAFYLLFDQMGLPMPTSFPVKEAPPLADKPIFIYGAGATSGAYTIQMLKSAGYRNVIATASPKHHEYLHSIGAKHTLDYAIPDLAEQILKCTGEKIPLVMDCIASDGSRAVISKVVTPDSTITFLLPIKIGNAVIGSQILGELPKELNIFPEGAKLVPINSFAHQSNEYIRDNMMPKILPSLLEAGIIQPVRKRIFSEGTLKSRAEAALDMFRSNSVSGEKVIIKID